MARSILILVAMLLLTGIALGADWGKERPIAVAAGSLQEQPAIDGHVVAWADNRSGNFDIFMFDLETGLERWVCINPLFQVSPAVSGDKIVWQDMRASNADIYIYDVVSRTESIVTSEAGNQTDR
jgi:TolB protein